MNTQDKISIRNKFSHIVAMTMKFTAIDEKTYKDVPIEQRPFADVDLEQWVEATAEGSPIPIHFPRELIFYGELSFTGYLAGLNDLNIYIMKLCNKFQEENNITNPEPNPTLKEELGIALQVRIPHVTVNKVKTIFNFYLGDSKTPEHDNMKVIQAFGLSQMAQVIYALNSLIAVATGQEPPDAAAGREFTQKHLEYLKEKEKDRNA